MKRAVTSCWVWLPVSALGVAAIVLTFTFLIKPPLGGWILATVFCSFLLWMVLSRIRRTVSPSQCPVCLYSLEGLTGQICPECGCTPREERVRSRGSRGAQRVIEAACLAFVVASVLVFISESGSPAIWKRVSESMGWPTTFHASNRLFIYEISTYGPGDGDSEDEQMGWNRTGEQLHLQLKCDSYPNEYHPDEVHTATVLATFGVPSLATIRGLTRMFVLGPEWAGEVAVVMTPGPDHLGFGPPGLTDDITSVSQLDVDSLVDEVLDVRLEHADDIDERLVRIYSDPAARSELKAVLATGWAPGRSTEMHELGFVEQIGAWKTRRGAIGIRYGGGGGGSGSRSGLVPAAITGIWVTKALGWLVAVLCVAALMRWYGRARPTFRELVPVRLRAIWRYLLRSSVDAAVTFVGGLRSDQPTCRGCGHPVTGLAQAICPECGCSLASGVVKAGAMRPEKRHLSGTLLLAASAIFAIPLLGTLMEGRFLVTIILLPIFCVLLYAGLRLVRAERSIEAFTPSMEADRRAEAPDDAGSPVSQGRTR
jgi:hypothetical protein